MRRSGQTLVLACITMLVLALMLMLSFNITNAIHEKIRIQNHADAQAYSVAVIEARAYNSLAYSNRAIAAAFVAQMSVHAWMAIASQSSAIHDGFAEAFGLVALMEIAMGCYPFNFSHCPDVIQAGIIAIQHISKASDAADKVKGHEQDFNDAVDQISQMIDSLHSQQKSVLSNAEGQIKSGGDMLKALKAQNAPGSTYDSAADDKNVSAFKCPLEGGDSGGMGGGGMGGGGCSGSTKSKEDRSKIMAAVANGTRNEFTNNNGSAFLASAGGDWFSMSNYLKDIQNNEGTNLVIFGTKTAVGESTTGDASEGEQLKTASAATTNAFVLAQWRHGVGVGGGTVNIASDNQSGEHNTGIFGNGHEGQHDKFPGCVDQDCFINFKLGDKNSNYNQPATYGAVSQSMRWTPNNNAPWEVNSNGVVTMDYGGDTGAFNLHLVPQKDAKAIAKGMVYFHQLGDWTVPPNMFDPFWRAKLAGFDDANEMSSLAGGDPYNGPVEGMEQ